VLTVPGSQTAWSSTGAVLGADSFADITYTATNELIAALGGATIAAQYGVLGGAFGAQSDFAFDLTVINASGLPVGILTNHAHMILGPDWFAARPEFAGLAAFIDAAEVGVPKPDPQAYLLASEALGAAPADVVFLDDTPACADGATAVGMTGIVVDPRDRRPAFDEARRLLGLA